MRWGRIVASHIFGTQNIVVLSIYYKKYLGLKLVPISFQSFVLLLLVVRAYAGIMVESTNKRSWFHRESQSSLKKTIFHEEREEMLLSKMKKLGTPWQTVWIVFRSRHALENTCTNVPTNLLLGYFKTTSMSGKTLPTTLSVLSQRVCNAHVGAEGDKRCCDTRDQTSNTM